MRTKSLHIHTFFHLPYVGHISHCGRTSFAHFKIKFLLQHFNSSLVSVKSLIYCSFLYRKGSPTILQANLQKASKYAIPNAITNIVHIFNITIHLKEVIRDCACLNNCLRRSVVIFGNPFKFCGEFVRFINSIHKFSHNIIILSRNFISLFITYCRRTLI